MQLVEENGWMIMNGCVRGDEKGEYTYTGGRGETVIDYILGNREVIDRAEKLKIGEEIDTIQW